MPYLYGQLIKAQLENTAADLAQGVQGRLWINTTSKKAKYDDGANIRLFGAANGGITLSWLPDPAGNAPLETSEFSQKVWQFAIGEAQKLYTVVKVPSFYTPGDPIYLRVHIYSPGTSGTMLISALSTLIRSGVDGFNSAANQRTSTNTAFTNATANVIREAVLDITSATGQVNAVGVSAGDLLKIQLFRGADTDVNDLRFIQSGAEAAF